MATWLYPLHGWSIYMYRHFDLASHDESSILSCWHIYIWYFDYCDWCWSIFYYNWSHLCFFPFVHMDGLEFILLIVHGYSCLCIFVILLFSYFLVSQCICNVCMHKWTRMVLLTLEWQFLIVITFTMAWSRLLYNVAMTWTLQFLFIGFLI